MLLVNSFTSEYGDALCGDIATHHSKYRQLHRVDALGICILMDELKMDNIYLNNIEKEYLF